MAGSSERNTTDLLVSIQRQINDFSDGFDNDASMGSIHLAAPVFNTDGLNVLQQKIESQLLQLEREVSKLEADRVRATMTKEEQLKALNDVDNLLPPVKVGEDATLEAEIEQLQKELNLLASQTGLSISKTKNTITDIGEDRLRKHHQINGSCYDTNFKIKFDVDEVWEDTGKVRGQLLNTQIHIPDDDSVMLMPVLKRIEPYNSITLIFRVLLSYAEWKSHKNKLFVELGNCYQGDVEVAEKNALIVRPPQQPGCEWHFIFDAIFSNDIKLKSTVQLKLQVPEECLEEDVDGVYKSAPSKFKLMQTTFGSFAAVRLITKTLLEE